MRLVRLALLVVLIGLPLYAWEKLTGEQPERLVSWLDRRLGVYR